MSINLKISHNVSNAIDTVQQQQFKKELNVQNIDKTKLEQTAKKFESAFVAQMFEFADIGAPKGSMDNQYISQTFSSFMSRAYADAFVEQGGLGMTDMIVQSLYQTQIDASKK